jgi:peptidoglycan/LPS O-acetylase OafA/YrhL
VTSRIADVEWERRALRPIAARPPEGRLASAAPRGESYMRQIDGLRALAVFAVILSHWTTFEPFWLNGTVGVQLFFVISGFLITGILLDARDRAAVQAVPRRAVLLRFYARRFLRIFPLFYGTLLVTYVAGFSAVRSTIAWHLAYLSNVLMAVRGTWLGEVSHFWSLAVEEQFYLAWPLALLAFRRSWLVPALVAAVVAAPVFRFLGEHALHWNVVQLTVWPVASLDTLGLGALCAVLVRARGPAVTARLVRVAAVVAAVVLGGVVALGALGARVVAWPLLYRLLLPYVLLGVVYGAATGVPGLVGRALGSGVLVYLGRVSYGLYVFHNFVPTVTVRAFDLVGRSKAAVLGPAGSFALDLALLVAAAAVSWRWYERPLNDLKRRVPYT